MKKTILFKTLVDILYFLHFIGLIGIFFILPFGIVNTNQVNMDVEEPTLFFWIIALISLATYIIFLRGLFYLRKMAKSLLSKNFFSELIIRNSKNSGIHFLLTGILSIIVVILLWFNTLFNGKLELQYNFTIMFPLFLMIIGVFLIIQSKTLFLAKNLKEENELTV